MTTLSYEELDYRYNPYTKQIEQIDVSQNVIDGLKAEIVVNREDISLTVTQLDSKANKTTILSEINLSEEGAFITGDRISLNGDVNVEGSFTMDNINDGVLYSRVNSTSITAGSIILSQVTGDLDDISDGSVYKKITSTEKTGAERAYSALDANNRYTEWLAAGELSNHSLVTTNYNGVILDNDGLQGFSNGNITFQLLSDGGDAFFKGDIYAVNGTFTGSISSTATITGGTLTGGIVKTKDSLFGQIIIQDEEIKFYNISGITIGKFTPSVLDTDYLSYTGPLELGSNLYVSGSTTFDSSITSNGSTYLSDTYVDGLMYSFYDYNLSDGASIQLTDNTNEIKGYHGDNGLIRYEEGFWKFINGGGENTLRKMGEDLYNGDGRIYYNGTNWIIIDTDGARIL